MATKFFLRVGAWYKSETGKALTSDIDITDVVNNTDPNNPFIEDDGSLGGANVVSITAGTNITLGGTASDPIINASGGGATPTLDAVLAAGATLTANRAVTLDGFTLNINQGANSFLSIDPTAGAEISFLQAYNTTGDGNLGVLRVETNDAEAKFYLSAAFNAGIKESTIQAVADATTSTIAYETDIHEFTGDVILDDLSGGGTTGLSIDDDGKLIRTP